MVQIFQCYIYWRSKVGNAFDSVCHHLLSLANVVLFYWGKESDKSKITSQVTVFLSGVTTCFFPGGVVRVFFCQFSKYSIQILPLILM